MSKPTKKKPDLNHPSRTQLPARLEIAHNNAQLRWQSVNREISELSFYVFLSLSPQHLVLRKKKKEETFTSVSFLYVTQA